MAAAAASCTLHFRPSLLDCAKKRTENFFRENASGKGCRSILTRNMTSLENRNSSALFKRAEQLKRWQESETNHEPSEPKRKSQRIQFTDGCVFLAACAASDKEEVERLLKRGADIDTANIDGLTALHQVSVFNLIFVPR